MRKITLALAAAAAFSIAAPAQATTTILSEDFTSGFGVFAVVGQVGINTGNDYVPCCGTTGSVANMSNPFASFGSGGQPSGTLSTTLNTLTGQEYTISFDVAALGILSDGLNFFLDGAAVFAVVENADNNLDTAFDTFDFNFIAAGPTTILSIIGENSRDSDAILDNISVATAAEDVPGVPEPSTWAMMLLGFGAVGVAMRRRRRVFQAA
jgi:PEP-CTERM motif-containing protein